MDGIKFFNLSAHEIDQKFFDFLVQILKENDLDASVEKIQLEGQSWAELQKQMAGGRAALLSLEESEELIDKVPALPNDVKLLGCADFLMYQDGQWWPRLNLLESLRELIVKKAKSLDIKESAYVIGQGAKLRVTAALAVSLGFARLCLVGLSFNDVKVQCEKLNRSFIGIQWQPLEASSLTMQTVGATLLINTIPLSDNPSLMSDLAYFNFMRNKGLVVDVEPSPGDKDLMEEAVRAGLRGLNGYDIRVHLDYTILQRLGYSSLISYDEFSRRWLEILLKNS